MILSTKSTERQSVARDDLVWIAYAAIVMAGLVVGLFAFRRSGQAYIGVGLAVLLVIIVAWWAAPRFALGATVFLALIGDIQTVSWWPFTKNLSSQESILYISDGASISPFEISLGVGLFAAVLMNISATGRPYRPAPLLVPMLIFAGFCVLGLMSGLARGGDFRIALFEIRPVLYLPAAYFLFVSVCATRRDYHILLSTSIVAIVVQSLFSFNFLLGVDEIERGEIDTLIEHGSAIGMNLLVVVLLLAIIIPNTPRWIPWTLLVALIPVGIVYIVSQRRAAIVALGGAAILIALHMWWRQRALFWKIVPVTTVLVVGYVGAFWNVQSSAGFAAQAVKAVVAPDQLSGEDLSSNLYRQIETYNLWATVRAEPLFGQGFGRPFIRVFALPDISTFEFNEYIPHNSLLWVWIKTGIGGFLTFLYMIARAMTLGTERYRRMPDGMSALVSLVFLSFILMFGIFLFVDIAWEARNVLLLAMAFGLCTGTFAPSSADGPSVPPLEPSRRSVTDVSSRQPRRVERLDPARSAS